MTIARKKPLVIIAGPTGTGKSAVACALAAGIRGEIINADSRQFYQETSIGTAMPSREALQQVPHHLVGFLSLKNGFTAFDFRQRVEKLVPEIWGRNRTPLLVGGSGLYIRALLKGIFDLPAEMKRDQRVVRARLEMKTTPELHSELSGVDPDLCPKLHANDRVRIRRALEIWHLTDRKMSAWQTEAKPAGFLARTELHYFILSPERAVLYRNLDARTEAMFAAGWVEEVRSLCAHGFEADLREKAPIGYREIADHIAGKLAYEDLVTGVKQKMRNYAKRQLTWFRREEGTVWLQTEDETPETVARRILAAMNASVSD